MPIQILEFIRSLSFGALVVNGLLLLIFSRYRHLFPSGFGYKEVIAIGTLLGTIVHHFLHKVIFNPLTNAMGDSFAFYSKLAELNLLYKNEIISEMEYSMFSAKLKQEYFGISLDSKLMSSQMSQPERQARSAIKDIPATDTGAIQQEYKDDISNDSIMPNDQTPHNKSTANRRRKRRTSNKSPTSSG